MMRSAKFYLKHGGKVSDKRAKKRASKWIGRTSSTVSRRKTHRKATWI